MKDYPEFAIGTRVVASGTLVIGAGNNIALLGILTDSHPSPTFYISQGTSALAAPTTIIAALTCASNSFTRIPAYCSGGATFTMTGVTPDLTIYWNPVSGVSG